MKNTEQAWTFRSWLACFKGVDLPIGDLAVDVMADQDFPTEERFGTILEHLYDKHVASDVLETFADAWAYYKATTGEVGTLDELAKHRGI